eukprot:2524583-Rhodomonas_salina.2
MAEAREWDGGDACQLLGCDPALGAVRLGQERDGDRRRRQGRRGSEVPDAQGSEAPAVHDPRLGKRRERADQVPQQQAAAAGRAGPAARPGEVALLAGHVHGPAADRERGRGEREARVGRAADL